MSLHSSGVSPAQNTNFGVLGMDLHLTADEIRILRQCNNEGIYTRALPLGLFTGTAMYFATKSGFIKPNIFGMKTMVFISGALGYFIGRFSYGHVCFQQLLNHPNSTLKQRLLQTQAQQGDMFQKRHSALTQPNTSKSSEEIIDDIQYPTGTDLDLQSPSSYDPIPPYDDSESNYETEGRESGHTEYTNTYDELRKKNRKEYIDRMWDNSPQEGFGQSTLSDPQRRYRQQPIAERPTQRVNKPSPDTELGTHKKTKYGDLWE